jgi:hypothetical protein
MMKIGSIIFSFFFMLLIAIPTLKVVKSKFGCQSSCSKEQKSEMPKGCQKEKCVLNLNFSTGQFIVEQIHEFTFNREIKFENKRNLNHNNVFISSYKNTIWHPPKKEWLA